MQAQHGFYIVEIWLTEIIIELRLLILVSVLLDVVAQ